MRRRSPAYRPKTVLSTLLVASGCLVLTACASGPPVPTTPACGSCDLAFAVCRKRDDYDPCRNMLRYCLGWCQDGESCEDGCDGALWGCQASDLRRSTCDTVTQACQASCGTPKPTASD